MTLTLPPELAGLVARAGGRWPQADEDALHDLSGTWRSLAGDFRGLKDTAAGVARDVNARNHGASIDAFGRFWGEFESRLDTVQRSADAVADGVDAMAKGVLAAKTAIAKGAAEIYGRILEVQRRASMSGGLPCAVGIAIGWLLRFLGKYILRVLGWLWKWIWRGISWLFKKIWAGIVAVFEWFRRLFKGKKQQPKTKPWADGKPPKAAQEKVPKEWGPGSATKKAAKDPNKPGWRWRDPNNPSGNGIRIDKGDPNSPNPSQRVDHVVIQHNGKTIGRNGQPVGSVKGDPQQAHIPLDEWLKWGSWYHP